MIPPPRTIYICDPQKRVPNRQQAHTPGLSARTASAHEGEKRRTRAQMPWQWWSRGRVYLPVSSRPGAIRARFGVRVRAQYLDGEQGCVKETTRRRNFRTSVVRARVCIVRKDCAQLPAGLGGGVGSGRVKICSVDRQPKRLGRDLGRGGGAGSSPTPECGGAFPSGRTPPSCMHARRKKRDAQEARNEESTKCKGLTDK